MAFDKMGNREVKDHDTPMTLVWKMKMSLIVGKIRLAVKAVVVVVVVIRRFSKIIGDVFFKKIKFKSNVLCFVCVKLLMCYQS